MDTGRAIAAAATTIIAGTAAGTAIIAEITNSFRREQHTDGFLRGSFGSALGYN